MPPSVLAEFVDTVFDVTEGTNQSIDACVRVDPSRSTFSSVRVDIFTMDDSAKGLILVK